MEKQEIVRLIPKCQNGDEAALNQLMEEIQPTVFYQCRKILGNETDAEDATQEILILVLEKLGQLREAEAFWGWLNRMTANHCKNALTRRHPELQFWEDEEGNSILDNLEDLDEQTVPDRAIDNAETCRMVSELVDRLPPAQRMCVMMYYYDEIPVKEIAESTDASENTVKSRLNYARKSIKEGVLDYEKQGIKLYGLSPLPFLLYFLRKDAQSGGLSQEAARRIISNALASAGVAEAVSSVAGGSGASAATAGNAAGAGAAEAAGSAAGSASSGIAGAAKAAAGKAAAKVLSKTVTVKVAAIAAAGTLLAGGAGGSILTQNAVSDRADAQVAEAMEQVDAEIQAGIEAGKPHTPEDFAALLDEYVSRTMAEEDRAWVDTILKKADALAADGNYAWAIRLVNNGLSYLPDDGQLQDAKDRLTAAAPVWLFGMEHSYNDVVFQPHETTITTRDGTIYGADRAIYLHQQEGAYIQYALNGAYTRLTGLIYPTEYFRWTSNSVEDFRLVLLADGEIIEDFRFNVDGIGHGTNLDLDVTGVQVLQIQFYDLNNSGSSLGNGSDAKVGLIDFYLHP